MSRFITAFDNFFDEVQYYGVDSSKNNKKEIIFLKNDKYIPIDDLSSGEQQIVFRGAKLLKNSSILNQGIVLIDEPELSMHPKWQKKILNYYQNIFSHNGQQNVQMIIATQSQYVIESALKDDDILVYLLNENKGELTATRAEAPFVLPTVSAAEINYHIFKIPTADYFMQLYAKIKGDSSVEEADKFIENSTPYKINSNIYSCLSNHGKQHYKTLPTYIRNAISHPENNNIITDKNLELSINLLIDILNDKEYINNKQ